MNKLILISAFIFISLLVNSQELITPFIKGDSVMHRAETHFEGYYNSLAFSNDFTSLFYSGGYLDSTLKSEISNRLNDNNRIGIESIYGITYFNYHTHLFGKPEWGWYASVENLSSYFASFSKNSFDLLFFGNSRFAGDTVQLADINAQSLTWQKFTFGTFHKNNNSYIGVSFLKGQNYASLSIDNAELYTAPLGEEVSLNLQAKVQQSDSLHKNLDAINGWGFSTDIVFYLNIGKNRNVKFQNAFRVALQNFGFIKWNSNTTETLIDSNYYFDGFDVDDLFDSASYNFSDRMKDSLQINPVTKEIATYLPFSFSISKVADPNSTDKIQGLYGVRLRAFSFYRPLFFAGIYFQPNKKINMNLTGSVGGYGKFRIGYGIHFIPIKNLNISVSSGNLIGWTKSGFGKDLSAHLSYAF